MINAGLIPKRALLCFASRPKSLIGFGGLGGTISATSPKTRSVAAVHITARAKAKRYEGPRQNSHTYNKQARAIPPGEVQPMPANDETRTEPAGAVRPRTCCPGTAAINCKQHKKNFVCNTTRSRVKIWPDRWNARQAGHNAAKYPRAILSRGRRKRPDRTGANVDRRGGEPGAWNPKGTRPNFRPDWMHRSGRERKTGRTTRDYSKLLYKIL